MIKHFRDTRSSTRRFTIQGGLLLDDLVRISLNETISPAKKSLAPSNTCPTDGLYISVIGVYPD